MLFIIDKWQSFCVYYPVGLYSRLTISGRVLDPPLQPCGLTRALSHRPPMCPNSQCQNRRPFWRDIPVHSRELQKQGLARIPRRCNVVRPAPSHKQPIPFRQKKCIAFRTHGLHPPLVQKTDMASHVPTRGYIRISSCVEFTSRKPGKKLRSFRKHALTKEGTVRMTARRASAVLRSAFFVLRSPNSVSSKNNASLPGSATCGYKKGAHRPCAPTKQFKQCIPSSLIPPPSSLLRERREDVAAARRPGVVAGDFFVGRGGQRGIV